MPLFPADAAVRLTAALFRAVGSPADEADLTARELVSSSLTGHDSHGVLRVPDYLDLVAKGTIVPGGPVRVWPTGATTVLVHGGRNFGQVCAARAVQDVIRIAKQQQTACVITRGCNHIGRLGSYVQTIAEHGLVVLLTCNSPVGGHFVLPWGGREGRLATNPLAYGIPSSGKPLVADFSTSVTPEGKIRVYRNAGKPLPPGWVLDAEGRPTTDPAAFYGPPRGGILPLGGAAGHKGFALGLLVEILGSALAGHSCTDPDAFGNGVCFLALDPGAFVPVELFKALVSETVAYVKSSPPAAGFEEVLVPGEVEFRTQERRSREGIPIDDVTWQAIRDHARRLGLPDALTAPV